MSLLEKLLLKFNIVKVSRLDSGEMKPINEFKWCGKLEHYITFKKFDQPIKVVREDNVFVIKDGYSTYLIVKHLLNKKWTRVVIENGKN